MKIKNLKFKIEMRWWTQRLKNVGHYFLSWYYVYKNGYPAKKLTVIGVTGTDGKTTTATLIYEILKAAGMKAGMISTVEAKYISEAPITNNQEPNKSKITNSINEKSIETGLHTTNPDAKALQPILKKMTDEGVTHLVLEATAHGLDQHRVAGCNISIGVLTNVTREHLDDFITMDRYRKAKIKLFTQNSMKYAILNEDDNSFKNFQSSIFQSSHKIQIIKYSKIKLKEISPALEGEYNLYNLGAAAAVAKVLGIEKHVAEVAKNFAGAPGRREEVKAGQPFKVYVDFAHTPNALEQVLKSLKGQGNQLTVVFGCTGERDSGKRPIMGRIASMYADKAIITSDDTRMENQEDIYKQIVSGIPANMMNKVMKENDRRKAIEKALKMANRGDVVLLAGKGHEKSINLGGKEYQWNDAKVAREIIKELI